MLHDTMPLRALHPLFADAPNDPDAVGSWVSAPDVHTLLRLALVKRDGGLCLDHTREAAALHRRLRLFYEEWNGYVAFHAHVLWYYGAVKD